MKTPFTVVNFYANRLLIGASVFTDELSIFYWDAYNNYIDVCGWTDKEFDAALLLKINKEWDITCN